MIDMNNQIPCPRCGQGWVLDVRIVLLNQEAFLCEECEALWFQKEEICRGEFVDFGDFMLRNGGQGLWPELEVRGAAAKA
jgi:hypothetical protein